MRKDEIKPRQVYASADKPNIQYVVVEVYDDSVLLERITERNPYGGSNRHALGFGWFEHTYTKPLRTMRKNEFNDFKI